MPNSLELRVAELEKIIADMRKSDRYVFAKDVQIMDGRDIQLAKGRGTMIGTEASQKLGFYGATPVIQQPGAAYVADATYNNNEMNMLNYMFQAGVAYGLFTQ